MVHVRELRDRSLEFEGERPSGASLSPPLLGLKGPSEEDPGMSPDFFIEGDLLRLAPFTVKVIVQRPAGRTETYEGVA